MPIMFRFSNNLLFIDMLHFLWILLCLFMKEDNVFTFLCSDQESSSRSEGGSHSPGQYAQEISNLWINITTYTGTNVWYISLFSMISPLLLLDCIILYQSLVLLDNIMIYWSLALIELHCFYLFTDYS